MSPSDLKLDPVWIHRFRAATKPQELAELFLPGKLKKNETESREHTLRSYLGDSRYDQLLARVKRHAQRSVRGQSKGNVVLLPGVMGSELSLGPENNTWKLWVNYWYIYRGYMSKLELDATGTGPAPAATEHVEASGLMNEYYGDLLLRLGESFNAQAFPYDWRLSNATAADRLRAFLEAEFGTAEVTLVAHSMGGLVARKLMAQLTEGSGPRIKRLVMLGTPNYGSFEVPLIFAALQDTVKDLIRLTGGVGGFVLPSSRKKATQALLGLLDTFPGIYEMLPVDDVPGLGSSAARRCLYNKDVYSRFNSNVSATHLQSAPTFQQSIAAMVDPDRMTYVAGCNHETVAGVLDPNALDSYDSYEITLAGDGRVPHSLGLLAGVTTYFVGSTHGDLPRDESVLGEIENLVLGITPDLPTSAPCRSRSTGDVRALSQAWAARKVMEDRAAEQELREQMQRLPETGRGADADVAPAAAVGSAIERRLVQAIFTGARSIADKAKPPLRVNQPALQTPPLLSVRLIYGNIATTHEESEPDPVESLKGAHAAAKNARPVRPWKDKPRRPIQVPKDVLALGRYVGVRPFSALRDLDERISAHLFAKYHNADGAQRHYLQDMIDRGLLRGDLAAPSLVPDPRDAAGQRTLALMGMGTVGQYGQPEARRVARELVWVLGQAGKKHLATIVFGAGAGSLGTGDAVRAFMEGAAEAIQSEPRDDFRLHTITFVEYYGDRIRDLDEVLRELPSVLASSVRIDYAPYTESELRAISLRDEVRQRRERQAGRIDKSPRRETTVRIVSELTQDEYWFSALTNTAAVPQRPSLLTPEMIEDSNNRVVAANLAPQQLESARVLFKCIPPDLRKELRSGVPIVMEVDSNTARIHWEMLYRHTADTSEGGDFLGLERGFTRQLRTTFAPPPQPSTSRRRILKALVVADPAADAPLEGARREGEDVVALFEEFNQHAPDSFRIEVTAMIGPDDAKFADVVHKLLDGNYDILHYAGHCFFDADSPSTCGWIFCADSKARKILSVRELCAFDAIPPFIFANACESGITPFRREQRNVKMAPAFAEAFFQRGVRDFLCTAWPVGDAAARIFAVTFYARMLGMLLDSASEKPAFKGMTTPTDMVNAVRDARQAALKCGTGLTTWGAYQHYGNPYTRFFDDDIAQARTVPTKASRAAAILPDDRKVTFERARQVARKYERLLHSIPGVLAVRPGYRFEDGWITDEPAVVVAVLDKVAVLSDDHRLPTSLEGVRVDVVPATPQEQLQALTPAERERLGLPADVLAEVSPDEGDTRKGPGLLKYPKEPKLLSAFDAKIDVLCNVSPDNGWPTLEAFLTGPIDQLTVAMYDFTAPHIRDRILQALGDKGKLTLVLCPASGGAKRPKERGVKDNDFDEDALLTLLREKLKKRLTFAWAAVPIEGKTTNGYFPRAYHIKVAVKDHSAVWLSSGNWQSSNQPSATDFPADESRKTAWRKYNRDWHVVINHAGMAKMFEKIILRDYDMASKLQARGLRQVDARMPLLFVPMDSGDLRADTLPVLRADTLSVNAKMRVQPLLTPDNYGAHVLKLIEGAKKKLYFINQSLSVHGGLVPESVLQALADALFQKVKDKLDVRIILRDISGVDADLVTLKQLGFPKEIIKVQPALHTKGIVVDSQRVLVGSQNWSLQGVDANRDASLIFENATIAQYFEDRFLHDWERLARYKVTSLENPPRLLMDGMARSAAPPANGRFMTWDDYFGG